MTNQQMIQRLKELGLEGNTSTITCFRKETLQAMLSNPTLSKDVQKSLREQGYLNRGWDSCIKSHNLMADLNNTQPEPELAVIVPFPQPQTPTPQSIAASLRNGLRQSQIRITRSRLARGRNVPDYVPQEVIDMVKNEDNLGLRRIK